MFKLFNYLFWGCVAMMSLTSCEKNNGMADGRFESALFEKYPDAVDVRWTVKGNYHIAEFKSPMTKASQMIDYSAWFDNSCQWQMTETDILFDMLPQAVKDAFAQSEYAQLSIDDVDRLEREGVQTIYVIEVEGLLDGVEVEIDLFYSEDGILIRTEVDRDVDDDYDDFLPQAPTNAISEFIAQKYPGSSIVDIDREDNGTEVEIIDGRVSRDLFFDRNDNWVYTETEIRKNDIPENILEVIANSEYSSYEIDDVEYIETPQANYYKIELENPVTDHEVTLKINIDGTLI